MFGYPTAVFLFTVAACGAWACTLVWALKLREQRFLYVTVLLVATFFLGLSESLGIRLGKYQYHSAFPLALPLGGTPSHSDLAWQGLNWIAMHTVGQMGIPGCDQLSWNIPFPVVALEAAFVVAFFRISLLRLTNSGWSAAFAAAGLNALLVVNLDAILDPVVSTSVWCGTAPDPNYHGLTLGLWQWFTNDTHPGYWFGVPLVNFISWFVAVGTFSFLLRLETGPRGLLRRYKHWFKYVLAVPAVVIVLFIIQVPIKIGIDLVLVRGQDFLFDPHPVVDNKIWHFGVMVVLLLWAVRLMRRYGEFSSIRRIDWTCVAAQILVFAFCLGALWFDPSANANLWAIWFLTAAIASTVESRSFVARVITRIFGGRPTPQIEVSKVSPHGS